MDDRRTLLVVEDDAATAQYLVENLRADGFRVAAASSAGEGVRAVEVRGPDLVVLDVVLGTTSGLEVLDRIRGADGLSSRIDPRLPVLVLSGRAGEEDRVRGFARGADDFLAKPFSYAELLARIRALLRRTDSRVRGGALRVGELSLDPVTRAVRLGDRPIELTAKEFALLHALAVDPERVLSKADLLRDVWGYAALGATRTVDAHACRLRKKLGGSGRPWIVSVRGVGYRLTEVR